MRRVAASISFLQARNSAHCRGLAVAFWKFWVVIFARHLCFVLLPVTRLIGDQKSWSCSDYRLNSKRSSGGEGNQLAMDRALGSWDSVTNGNGVHSTQT